MKLPSGILVERAVPLPGIDFRKSLSRLIEKKFSGYAKLSADLGQGIEEGTLLFRKGSITAASYEYSAHGITLHSHRAFEHIFNTALSENAVLDVARLTEAELDLSEAVNPESLVRGIGNAGLSRHFPASFSKNLHEKALGSNKKQESKEAMLKRLGIDKLSR